jgi:hypothetical protein
MLCVSLITCNEAFFVKVVITLIVIQEHVMNVQPEMDIRLHKKINGIIEREYVVSLWFDS